MQPATNGNPTVPLAEDKDDADENGRLRDAALDDLVERLSRGEEYPRNVHSDQQLNRRDILNDSDHDELVDAVIASLAKDQEQFEDRIALIVRNYLRDTQWHQQRIDEMRVEEDEAARERAEGI
jgi:hypothetical protein